LCGCNSEVVEGRGRQREVTERGKIKKKWREMKEDKDRGR